MTITSSGMSTALQGLQEAIGSPRATADDLDSWRWMVQARMTAVRAVLDAETDDPDAGWLVAREGGVLRERTALLDRMSILEPRVLASPQVDGLHNDLCRLVVDLNHHVQRLHDLAYDEVELELGGSE